MLFFSLENDVEELIIFVNASCHVHLHLHAFEADRDPMVAIVPVHIMRCPRRGAILMKS